MEKPSFNLVRAILKTPYYQSQPKQIQQIILGQIVATGEITEDELNMLINEEKLTRQQVMSNNLVSRVNFESFDYNTFLNFIINGNIKGKDLIAICNSSKKLNDYCNNIFQPVNGNGIPTAPPQNQYLFRVLLNKMRVRIPIGKSPRQVYIDKTIGGQVLAFGSNEHSEIKLAHDRDVLIPIAIPGLNNIIEVSASSGHILFLDNQGRVWGLGYLALENDDFENVPTLIPNLNNIIKVSAGNNSSYCLNTEGRVITFGRNYSGELGFGDTIQRNTPTLIPNLNNIVQVSDGYNHCLCLDKHGRVWGIGENIYGQLGLGDTIQRNIPTLIPNLNNIVQVACGIEHSVCLDNQGRVWTFGDNEVHQLGIEGNDQETPVLNPYLNNIIQIACGSFHTLCLDNQGQVWSFGYDRDGQLGSLDVEESSSTFPVQVSDLENIVEVRAKGNHSICLDNKEQVWVFGDNMFGQLGLGDTKNQWFATLNPNLSNIIYINTGVTCTICITRL